MRTSRTLGALLAIPALLVPCMTRSMAQEVPTAPAAATVPEEEKPWAIDEGLFVENVELGDPASDDAEGGDVTTRGGVPGNVGKQVDMLDRYQSMLLTTLEKYLNKGPDGTGSNREEVFKAQNLLIAQHVIAPPFVGAIVGGLTGGGVGLVIDACTAEMDFSLGAIGLGLLGTASGTAAGLAYSQIATIVIAANTERLASQYPPNAAAGPATRGQATDDDWTDADFDEADAWTEYPLDPEAPALGAEGDGVDSRGGVKTRTMRAVRRRAGPQESAYVHLVQRLFNMNIVALAASWENAPFLSAKQKRTVAQLKRVSWLRKSIEHVAYVKRYGRTARNALLAGPLSGKTKQIVQSLTADAPALRSALLDAVGLAKTRMQARKGRLEWSTPSALRVVGAPAKVSVKLPSATARAGGNGGVTSPYLEARLNPGPFDVTLGEAKLSGNNVVIGFRVKKGSKVCSASVRYKMGGKPVTIGNCSPRLTRDLTGSIALQVAKTGFSVSRVTLGNHSLRIGLPHPKIPPVGKLVKSVESKIKKRVKSFLASRTAWDGVAKKVARAVSQRMLKVVKANARKLGLDEITAIRKLRIQGGTFALEVAGKISEAANLPLSKRDLNAIAAILRQNATRMKQ